MHIWRKQDRTVIQKVSTSVSRSPWNELRVGPRCVVASVAVSSVYGGVFFPSECVRVGVLHFGRPEVGATVRRQAGLVIRAHTH